MLELRYLTGIRCGIGKLALVPAPVPSHWRRPPGAGPGQFFPMSPGSVCTFVSRAQWGIGLPPCGGGVRSGIRNLKGPGSLGSSPRRTSCAVERSHWPCGRTHPQWTWAQGK